MNKRYVLIMKYNNLFDKTTIFKTDFFYTLEEARITANVENENHWLTTIIDLEDSNIKWQGDK